MASARFAAVTLAVAALVLTACSSQGSPHAAPSSSAQPTASPVLSLTCAALGGKVGPMVRDLRKQNKLVSRALAGPLGATAQSRHDIRKLALYAWVPPHGEFSGDLTRALNTIDDWVRAHNDYGSADTGLGNIDPSTVSNPASLTREVYNFNYDGTLVTSNVADLSNFGSFKAEVAALATDCGSG
jgi:hypothetical protein